MVERCEEREYSVVSVRCKDRAKLMFDIVCTLTDMQYMVFHASILSDGSDALQVNVYIDIKSCSKLLPNSLRLAAISVNSQEYYIRHMDGCTLNNEAKKERVIKCLEAAIRGRVSEHLLDQNHFAGFFTTFLQLQRLSLELCAEVRVGLLSQLTRIFQRNGLTVTRVGEQVMVVFYVRDTSQNPVDMKVIEALRKEISHTMILDVKKLPTSLSFGGAKNAPKVDGLGKTKFFFGNLVERFLP